MLHRGRARTAAVVAAAQGAVLLDDVKVAAVHPHRVKAQLVHRHRVLRRHLRSTAPVSEQLHRQSAPPCRHQIPCFATARIQADCKQLAAYKKSYKGPAPPTD